MIVAIAVLCFTFYVVFSVLDRATIRRDAVDGVEAVGARHAAGERKGYTVVFGDR